MSEIVLDEFRSFLSMPMDLFGVSIVAVVISGLMGFIFRLSETRFRLEAEYRYEQRKHLRELVGKYQGRLLSYGDSFNHRMWNLYRNQGEGWLDKNGHLSSSDYYYLSFLYRFLCLCAIIREFEKESIVIDIRIGTRSDIHIANLVSALRWSLTDVDVFAGLGYEHATAKDHFFSDELRQVCDDFVPTKSGSDQANRLIGMDNIAI